MNSPLRSMLRRQVKLFTADNQEQLEREINDFLKAFSREQILDVKYAADMPEPGILLHTALVFYET